MRGQVDASMVSHEDLPGGMCKSSLRVVVPLERHPNYNFIGRLLGPRCAPPSARGKYPRPPYLPRGKYPLAQREKYVSHCPAPPRPARRQPPRCVGSQHVVCLASAPARIGLCARYAWPGPPSNAPQQEWHTAPSREQPRGGWASLGFRGVRVYPALTPEPWWCAGATP